jgi:hypothetical protein
MAYGNKRDYPKIDIYIKTDSNQWIYRCSTTWAKTCKEAVARFKESSSFNPAMVGVKANFSKN